MPKQGNLYPDWGGEKKWYSIEEDEEWEEGEEEEWEEEEW